MADATIVVEMDASALLDALQDLPACVTSLPDELGELSCSYSEGRVVAVLGPSPALRALCCGHHGHA